jgi:glycosyl transferase, family 25
MKTFLINLDSATERLSAAQLQLSRIGLSFERVSAIRGANLSKVERTELYSSVENARCYFQPMSDGEIGCYASHLKIWKIAQASRLSCSLILEDDLTVSDQLVVALQAIEKLPIGWDVIRLNTRKNESALASQSLTKDVDLIRFKRVPSRTTAYVISAQGVSKLLQRLPPVYRPIDIDMRYFWEFNLEMLGVHPALVSESELSLQSSIDRPEKKSQGNSPARRRWAKLTEQLRYTLANHRARSKQFPWQL